MIIYLMETDASNDVVFYENGMAKVMDCAPTGMLDDVVDIYADNAAEELKKYFSEIKDDLNGFWEMPGNAVEFNPEDEQADIKLTIVFHDDL